MSFSLINKSGDPAYIYMIVKYHGLITIKKLIDLFNIDYEHILTTWLGHSLVLLPWYNQYSCPLS